VDENEIPSEDTKLTKTTGDPAPTSPAQLPATIGQYRILGKLGEGGMGTVYEAQQAHPKRKVAVKIVRGGQFVDEQRVRMFQREADTLARLKHPNIAAIYESGRTEDGQHFFAMELVRGETLEAHLEKRPRALTPRELELRLRLFRKIADAVHYAHQRGVIHRDLKPSNIVVTEEALRADASTVSGVRLPEIKILDFGLARITEGDVAATTMATDVGVIKGTLPYMSPEQARGDPEEIDVRTDVYALGVLLYEMLTGSRPYDVLKKSLAEAVRVICEDSPRPLKQTWSGVRRPDHDIETILGKTLEKTAERRYASAAALSEDIGRYLTSQPILARPPSVTYQVRKFAQRNRVLVLGVAAIVVALAAGAVVSTWQAVRATRAEADASAKATTAERVSAFLADMLGDVDPQVLGRALWDDLHERVGKVRRERGATEDEIEAVQASLGDALSGVNATDAALRLVDEQILGRAAETIEQELAEEPGIAARLEHTIGVTYRKLGLYAQAEPRASHALEICRRVYGDDHPNTLNALNGLAELYDAQGRYAEAEPLFIESLETRKRVLGDEAPSTIGSMHSLAVAYAKQGRLAEAESLCVEVVETRRRVLGDEHPDTIGSLGLLAILHVRQGRYAEAESLFVEVLESDRRVLGEEHPKTLGAMANLALLYARQKRFAEAEALYLESLEIRRRVLGDEHPDTLVSLADLASTYSEQGRHDAAEPLLVKALEIRRRLLGDEHPHTLISMYSLGRLYDAQGRHAEAEPLYVESLEVRERVLGHEHPDTLFSARGLVGLYMNQRRWDAADELCREILETHERVLGHDHWTTLSIKKNLAWMLLNREPVESRDPREALQLALDAAETEGYKDPEWVATLAFAYHANGNTEKAIEMQEKALSLLPEGADRSAHEERLTKLQSALQDKSE
jgi:serine/threonine protein kinase/tetratricopeptide (TPR) repeat protein